MLAGLRAAGVVDERVLAAIRAVPRDRFVPAEARDEAWANRPLPIGNGQTISQPLVVARMCVLLELGPEDRVLDVGTGSGYHAAVLARLAGRVVGVELDPELAARAAGRLAGRVEVHPGDGGLGLPGAAPFDAINVAAAAPAIPAALEAQLAPGGRLVIPVGTRAGRDGDQQLVLVRRSADGATLARTTHGAVSFVPFR